MSKLEKSQKLLNNVKIAVVVATGVLAVAEFIAERRRKR